MKIEIVDDNEEGTAGRITEVEEGLEVDTCYICNRLAKLSLADSTHLNYLYNRGCCLQTPPRQRSTDPKPVCHFDPLLMEIDVSYRAFGLVVN